MGGLSMNPENPGLESGPKLASQIAQEEEDLGLNIDVKKPKIVNDEKPSKKKLGPFEFDTTYPRTIPGLIRIVQVMTLFVAFICLVMTTWPESGTFAFYCVFLVFGVILSGYLLFTIMAGLRGDAICGIRWMTVELVYFAGFGLIIFLGACLAANKAAGDAALQAAAAFGLITIPTFIYYAWINWKLRSAPPPEDEENKKDLSNSEISHPDEQDNISTRSFPHFQGDFHMENDNQSQRMSRPPSIESRGTRLSFHPGIYENTKEIQDNPIQRRRHSLSEKDSAYSEGASTPTRGKTIPQKIRRTGSGYNLQHHTRQHSMDNILQRQPLAHISHHPYAVRGSGRLEQPLHGRGGYGYPHDQTNRQSHTFNNMAFQNDEEETLNGRRKSMPEWLRAALGEDVAPSNLEYDDEDSEPLPKFNRNSTMPVSKRHEFPLLNSDEESINYPSISQNQAMALEFAQRNQYQTSSLPRNVRKSETMGRQHQHHRGSHLRRSSRRRHSRRHHHHPHHHRGSMRRHHHSRRSSRRHSRRPVDGAHEEYLRRMVENDELVSGKYLDSKPIDAGDRRLYPEQPTPIYFPDQSRWGDDQMDNPVMQKYFGDPQAIR